MRLGTQQIGDLLEKSGIDPMRRAETLSLLEWENLTRRFAIQFPESKK
jgi:hypothetical protein